MTGTVLILGASGRFGSNAAEAFWNAGWRVRLFDRKTDDLMQASKGADVIVNAWLTKYPDWADTVPALTRSVIDAARASGATVLIPGNVYVYGADAPERFGPDTPHAARNPLGQIRVEMEAAFRDAGIRTIILRAGDFLDTKASGNWFDLVMAKTLKRGVLTYPGALDAPHAWAYLPDLAEAAVELCTMRDALPAFADIPYAGYTLTGRDMADALTVALDHQVTARRMSWWPIRAMALVSQMMRSLEEMRYLWSKPHHLDPAPLQALLPHHRSTPLAVALRRAVPEEMRPNTRAPKDLPHPTVNQST